MQEIVHERYDAINYQSGAVPDSHPARLGAISRLHGIAAAAPDHCRVLELGCAGGGNLLPLAERFPQSEFVGIDFGSAHIAAAEEARKECDLRNTHFICADLREFEPEAGAYDYVIAHGVYSWVRDDVKDRLLSVCARALAPAGVAYVSYNTYPVWGLLGGLREFMLTETARKKTPVEQIEHARKVIGALNHAMTGQPGAYAELLRQSLSDMLQKRGDHLYHDDLAAVNDPCTFTGFTAHAASHGLEYLAEAHYATMIFEHVPPSMRAALGGLDLDFHRSQQFMDVMFQRWLRNSLVCKSETPIQRVAEPLVVQDCALGLRIRPVDSRVNLAPGAPMRLTGVNDLSLDFENPAEKALLSILAQDSPARTPFSQAVDRANGLLRQTGLPPIDAPAELCKMLYRLFTLDAVDLALTGDGNWLQTSLTPMPSPLMRRQARQGATVVNRWHEPVTITVDGQQYLTNPSTAPSPAALRAGLMV